jgi:hypothetical protein
MQLTPSREAMTLRMRTRSRIAVLFAVAVLSMAGLVVIARQTSAQSAVPISQEHHHHLVMENEYVRVYEVEVPAHEATLMHQHDRDYVYIVIGDADVTNQVQGKQAAKLHLRDTTVNFSKGPFAHIAVNDSDKPFRNVTIELLKPQGEVKVFAPSLNAALDSVNPDSAGIGVKDSPILETAELRVSAVEISGKGTWKPAAQRPRLTLDLYKFNELIESQIFPSAMKVGDLPYGFGWVDRGIEQFHGLREGLKLKILALEFR